MFYNSLHVNVSGDRQPSWRECIVKVALSRWADWRHRLRHLVPLCDQSRPGLPQPGPQVQEEQRAGEGRLDGLKCAQCDRIVRFCARARQAVRLPGTPWGWQVAPLALASTKMPALRPVRPCWG